MIFPLAAIAILSIFLSQTRLFARARAAVLPGLTQKAAAVGAVVGALVMLLHGNLPVALCLFGAGLWLLGRSSRSGRDVDGARTHVSRVRSAMIEMEYDQASGQVTGRVIAGQHEGVPLSRLDRAQCLNLYVVCLKLDGEGARLLEAYFDRRFAGWRPAGQRDGDPREQRARTLSRMSEDEAYEVLGLRRGAPRTEIVRAHRTVMKKWHPDQGGTAALAARANEAKEVLLRRHA